jgi:dolichol-phosphate mannosyltransferase
VKHVLWLIGVLQAILAVRVFSRMARTAGGKRIEVIRAGEESRSSVAVLVPVLDEAERIAPCLSSLQQQSSSVDRIVVIDGGSTDGTPELVRQLASGDPRLHLIDAAPVPAGVNGKAYGLAKGLPAVPCDIEWILTVDADVRLQPEAVTSVVDFAERTGVRALSVATSQRIEDRGLALVHPAMLTTLVYRFGIPGHATTNVPQVQANGQCFLIARALLDRLGGFAAVQTSICEDVTLARAIAARGEPVGFYEGGALVDVEMYRDATDAVRNWPRSLPMRDRYSGRSTVLGLAECLIVQSAPLWLLAFGLRARGRRHWFTQLQGGLLLARLGVLAGTARAYPLRPWTYWLSPLADLPITLEIIRRSRQRAHTWRGRAIVAGDYR